MYDVISIMKEKEVICGTFQAEAKKDQQKILGFTNEFEKNLSNGETKVKINTEIDCNGKKVKHESQTQFGMQGCGRHLHHGFMKHIHHHNHYNNGQNHEDIHCGGVKGKLTKLAYILDIFNRIKVDEKEDNSVVLSLKLENMPDEVKRAFHEELNQRKMFEHHHHHSSMKDCCALKDPKIGINVWINNNKEVEKIVLTADGKQLDQNESHDMNLWAELRLA